MLDLGVKLALPGARVLGYVEREAFAASVLLDRMETAHLEPAPVWCGDLADMDARPLRGHVDLITAGLPCQPYSVAGERKGNDDDRALWPEFVRLVRECEPAAVFIENVPGFLKLAEPLWTELQGLGYEWAPPYLATASEFGAIQERERVFLLATRADRDALWLEPEPECGCGCPTEPRRDRAGTPGANGTRLEEWGGERCNDRAQRAAPQRGGAEAPRPHGRGLPREWLGWLFDVERQTLRHDADGCGPRCGICGTPWEAESPPVRVDHGDPRWVDELRAIGNGVVPVVAARALRELWGMMG